ncbi:MAG: iron-containing alcohol dehydrogenase [Magnetospirillum sp. WYHS-4]
MDPFAGFAIARLPRLRFGDGTVASLPEEVAALGRRVLIVTGARSFPASPHWPVLLEGLAARGVAWEHFAVAGEPGPDLVDEAAARFRGAGIEVVLGIGGGSALDAAKAIAGLIPVGRSVMDYLEGVGPELPYEGPALPFVAAPTTAGTGSEATRNAVLGRQGPQGFKKSFRHDSLVARVAVVDPTLLATCPPAVLAADGMDAFTQLLESYVSLKASPFTDALVWSGLQAFAEGFFPVWEGGEGRAEGRRRLAYASLVSGIALAQTGLGSVHGMAPALGSLFGISHGLACGTLVAEATDVNIAALAVRNPASPALGKYAAVGRLLAGKPGADDAEARRRLVWILREWTDRLELARLGEFAVGEPDFPRIAAGSRGSSMKTNPLVLDDAEIVEVLRRRL